ncbi:DNA repair protein RecO [Propylenella binzhouense]|uniref:DNA repair protein RecO n=1 Tax=Propylenella binzhouense TaxID=2555902 RepID=A0A964WU43_9HYPH|nr:DNA repair protein RecO [Propylenella binzhouense]MYZ48712.1 DNA repair protein RecO [Propylenella binzhouense]
MEWSEEAIAVGTRRLGESSVILEVMTRSRGRCLGLVRGGRSKALRHVLQPGNSLSVTWRARLDEHLGSFRVEPLGERAAAIMESSVATFGLQLLAEHLRLLPERDPHPQLYDVLAVLLDNLGDPAVAGALIARFELLLLDELGFGLDLTACAATGTTEDLAFVSPKSGRAVSREAAQPYRDRLLPLPAFLHRSGATFDGADLAGAFALTGYFLQRHVWEARGRTAPEVRHAFLRAVHDRAIAA